MEYFVFTNRETHAAYEMLIKNAERLQVIVAGTFGREGHSLERLEEAFEEWLVEERPTQRGDFYDQLLESALLEIDFENLASAVKMWCLRNAEAQSDLVEA